MSLLLCLPAAAGAIGPIKSLHELGAVGWLDARALIRDGDAGFAFVGPLILSDWPGLAVAAGRYIAYGLASLLTLVLLDQIGSSAELDRLIKLTLSGAVIVTAVFTLFQELLASRLNLGRVRGELDPVMQRALTVAAGVLIGAVVTISSVGAGVIGMMILLILYPKHAPIRIVGSDLAHAVLITAIAGAGHARMGTVNYELLGWLLIGAMPGIWIGSKLGFGMNPKMLKRVIAGILIVVGSMTLWKTLHTVPSVVASGAQR